MELNEMAKEIHALAVSKGWWEVEHSLPEILMLCVSELSEALEIHRDGGKPTDYATHKLESDEKPYGIAVELGDCIMRILDYCGHVGIDIQAVIAAKHEYNKSRPYKHGGKEC